MNPWDLFKGFILGVVCGGIFVVPLVVMFVALLVAPMFFGFVWTGSDAQIASLVHWWLGLTIFSGLFTAWVANNH
jgi:hypothetical protein